MDPAPQAAAGVPAHDHPEVACTPTVPIADMALPLALAARALRDAMRDKSYRATPLGTYVSRYIRWFRNEYGATEASVRDYEAILARMALTLADRDTLAAVSTEDLRDVIDLWSARSGRTRQKVTSVIKSFWAWAEDQGLIALSPAGRIRRPKAERKLARPLADIARPRLLEASRIPRDRVGLYCLLGLGLRRDELAGVRAEDFELDRGVLIVMGKGRKERALPLAELLVAELHLYLAADLPHLGRPPETGDYLLYPVQRLFAGKGLEGAHVYRDAAKPKAKPSPQSVHRWWYRILWDAGLVPRGQTSGMNMHRARHLFAVELRRAAGLDAASQALGHSDLSTTLGIYGHRDETDLAHAMKLLEEYRRQHDEAG